MNRYFIRYPGFRKKALTLSYDDGVEQDIRLIQIMDRYGIKGTFNLNSGTYAGAPVKSKNRRISPEEALKLYKGSGHEVALHGFSHPFLEQLPEGVAAWEIVRDREILEDMFGEIIRGMAYPMGTFNDNVVETLRRCGVAYARTVKVSHGFDLPADWLRLEGTCRNKEPELEQLCDRFLKIRPIWGPKLFYMWGHSYEFDEDNGWEVIERFCSKMGGHDDIWYATNIEICDYVEACRSIRSSMNGCRIFNPTATPLYLEAEGSNVLLAPGEMLDLRTVEEK